MQQKRNKISDTKAGQEVKSEVLSSLVSLLVVEVRLMVAIRRFLFDLLRVVDSTDKSC